MSASNAMAGGVGTALVAWFGALLHLGEVKARAWWKTHRGAVATEAVSLAEEALASEGARSRSRSMAGAAPVESSPAAPVEPEEGTVPALPAEEASA